jgi:hypothetical protein
MQLGAKSKEQLIFFFLFITAYQMSQVSRGVTLLHHSMICLQNKRPRGDTVGCQFGYD